MRFLFLLVATLVAGCASQPQPDEATIELVNETTVQYRGSTDAGHVEKLEALLGQNPEVDTLVISSGGGDVLGGMRLGTLVHNNQLNVVVREACLSSCANYVVTSSPSVLVEQNALLGWHGGALQGYYTSFSQSWMHRLRSILSPSIRQEQARFLTEWKAKESAFFSQVNAEQAVTVLGMMPGLSERRNAPTFTYDRETLHRLGLKIHYEDDEPATQLPNGRNIVQVFKLSDSELAQLLEKHRQRLTMPSGA